MKTHDQNDINFRKIMRRRYAKTLWSMIYFMFENKEIFSRPELISWKVHLIMQGFMLPLYLYMRGKTKMLNDMYDFAYDLENKLRTMEHDYKD
uniref:Uncharacterized protein n=1 Tax=viral metagenome TaxID=1070528 RepID=A0A6M3K848_9ZZZZ